MHTEKTHYLISVTLQEVKAPDGKVMTEGGATGWLYYSDGWPQVSETKSWAYQFERIPSSAEILSHSRMPWYNVFKLSSVKVHKVVTTVTETTIDYDKARQEAKL